MMRVGLSFVVGTLFGIAAGMTLLVWAATEPERHRDAVWRR